MTETPHHRPAIASLTLEVLQESLAITKLTPRAPIPTWATQGRFFAIARSEDELSLVCDERQIPAEINAPCERPWRALKVRGPLDFALTGILATLAGTLADAGIAIFAISTFDTDYILVKSDKLEAATFSLQKAGHTIRS